MAKKAKKEEPKSTFQFFTPEEQDAIIKAKLAQQSINGSKFNYRWSEDALMVRRQVIIDLLGQGLSHFRIQQELMSRWGVCKTTTFNYIKDAIEYMAESSKEFYKEKTDLMVSRLEAIAEDALAHGDRKSALTAYEQINKITGLYINKIDADVKGDVEITFDFS